MFVGIFALLVFVILFRLLWRSWLLLSQLRAECINTVIINVIKIFTIFYVMLYVCTAALFDFVTVIINAIILVYIYNWSIFLFVHFVCVCFVLDIIISEYYDTYLLWEIFLYYKTLWWSDILYNHVCDDLYGVQNVFAYPFVGVRDLIYISDGIV